MLPPGPRAPSFVQIARWMLGPLGFLEESAARYGDIFTLRPDPSRRVVFTSNPEAIRRIFAAGADCLAAPRDESFLPLLGRSSLLMLNGREHQRHRRLLGKALQHTSRPEMTRAILSCTRASVDTWPTGRPFPVYGALKELLLKVLLKVLFGLPEARQEQLAGLISAGGAIGVHPLMLIPLRAQRVLGRRAPWARICALMQKAEAIIREQIARARTQPGDNILSWLLSERDDAGEGLSDDSARDEIMTLFFAAHDTTAATLAWTLSFVLSHPPVMAALTRETKETTEACRNGQADGLAAQLRQLPFLDAVLRESTRLRPVFHDVRRLLLRPMELLGYELPAGTEVAPCIYLVQRRADLFPEPERFIPERFLSRRPGTEQWMPFGGGLRRCVGMSFAWDLMKLILTTLLSRLTLTPASAEPPRPVRRFVSIAPSGGVPVIVQARLMQ